MKGISSVLRTETERHPNPPFCPSLASTSTKCQIPSTTRSQLPFAKGGRLAIPYFREIVRQELCLRGTGARRACESELSYPAELQPGEDWKRRALGFEVLILGVRLLGLFGSGSGSWRVDGLSQSFGLFDPAMF